MIEALDTAIANEYKQHTESQVEAIKTLKKQALATTTMAQWVEVFAMFLKIFGVTHHLPPDN